MLFARRACSLPKIYQDQKEWNQNNNRRATNQETLYQKIGSTLIRIKRPKTRRKVNDKGIVTQRLLLSTVIETAEREETVTETHGVLPSTTETDIGALARHESRDQQRKEC